ncbi:MAG: hypothetical protein ACRCVJ_15165 [Clostridium sp.]
MWQLKKKRRHISFLLLIIFSFMSVSNVNVGVAEAADDEYT